MRKCSGALMLRGRPAAIAASWKRPYTSVQWAWVRALGVEPSNEWTDRGSCVRRHDPKKRDLRDAMRQRVGVRGL